MANLSNNAHSSSPGGKPKALKDEAIDQKKKIAMGGSGPKITGPKTPA